MEHEIFKVMDQYAPLTHDDLVELHAHGKIEKIILHNLRFAYTEAQKCAAKYPGLDADEVIEGMLLGITEAANAWDPSKGAITSYISLKMRPCIKHMANQNKHAISRNTMHIWKTCKINDFVDEFKTKNKREPTIKEIAKGTEFSETTVYNIHNLGIKSVSSLNGSQSESDDGCDLNDIIPDQDASTPLDELSGKDISMIIERLIDGLEPLEKEVINRRWYERHKYNQIADDLQVAYPKIKQAEVRALAKLKRELELIETA